MEKTSHWAALYFVALMTFGNYVLFNLLVAILVEGFSAEVSNYLIQNLKIFSNKNNIKITVWNFSIDDKKILKTNHGRHGVRKEKRKTQFNCMRLIFWIEKLNEIPIVLILE